MSAVKGERSPWSTVLQSVSSPGGAGTRAGVVTCEPHGQARGDSLLCCKKIWQCGLASVEL